MRQHPFLRRKTLSAVQYDMEHTGMRRTLGPLQLVLFGIGCIVGAGVYVMTGAAAAQYAGPAVILSFVIAAVACVFIAMCYAELASVLPVSGASYAYAYTVLGEVYAWGLAWMLMFEFCLAGAALAAGFSGYFVSLLADFGIHVPAVISASLVQVTPTGHFLIFSGANFIAVAAIAAVTLILIRGISQSATANAVLVTLKMAILVLFVLVGIGHVHPENWHPFLPASQGGFHYGVAGVFRAASVLFFAYLGFEAVATAASETRKPQRDVPVGIIGALIVSTLLYVAVALVMTGLVSFRDLGVPDPISVAVEAVGMPVMAVIINAGALIGLASVLLVNVYAQSRLSHAIACDGLLPRAMSRLHPQFRTPVVATLIVAGLTALAAATLPIAVLGDLVSLGTICVFTVVAIAVMWLRNTHPELKRPFKMPFGGVRVRGMWIGVVPVCALIACALMAVPVLVDLVENALSGAWIPAAILVGYILVGAALYLGYGVRHARVGNLQAED